MERIIAGKVYVLGDNIDTDQIIPAEYLVFSLTDEDESKNYGKYALTGLELGKAGLPYGNRLFVKQGEEKSQYNIIIAGKNFGCGSSREHAPFALKKAGIKAIVANSYARIFYRNCIDGGFLIPLETKEIIWDKFKTDEEALIDLKNYVLINKETDKEYNIEKLGAVEEIVEA